VPRCDNARPGARHRARRFPRPTRWAAWSACGASLLGLAACGSTGQSGMGQTSAGQAGAAGGTPDGPHVHVRSMVVGGVTYRYAVYTPPGYSGAERWPAILFLHGRGESATNGTTPLLVGLPAQVLRNPEVWPVVLIVPNKPDMESQWEDHAPAVLAMLDEAERNWSIDPERVVLSGLSQGGHGCWTINAQAPGRFAALAPVCGYALRPVARPGQPRHWPFEESSALIDGMLKGAMGVPVWMFHGEADSVVPPEQTVRMAELFRARGGEVRVTLYPGVDHNSWDRAYAEPELREWMLKARRRRD